ncbi:MAG: hypothetical protein SGJ20_08205 [Planctomycetota bacterium]|nr:hypothetical protein [Planctomycetota bacterium]
MISAIANRHTLQSATKLVRKHHFQIIQESRRPELEDVFAITFRPGDKTSSFDGRTLRRLGSTVMIVLSCNRDLRVENHWSLPIRGFRARAHHDGAVEYGSAIFSHDGALSPRPNAKRSAINALRNPSLCRLLIKMDRACKRQVSRHTRLPQIPQFPRIWLGFSPSDPPVFEDTPALRRVAARELGISEERLGTNSKVLLDLLLQDLWERNLMLPGNPENSTGQILVDAEFCTQTHGLLQVHEDFSQLLGVATWNPAREVEPLTVENPARDILRKFDVDLSQNLNQFFPDHLIEQFELALRQAVGPVHDEFTTEEILDAFTNPDQALIGYSASLPQLRAKLVDDVSQNCTDDDLLRAARQPDEPLWASRACRIQVLAKRNVAHLDPLQFTADDLGRRIEADLGVGGDCQGFGFQNRIPQGTRRRSTGTRVTT